MGGYDMILVDKVNDFLTKTNMQNPQRLVFQQSPERQDNIKVESPKPGTDAKNVVSQSKAKWERLFEDTTVTQLYNQLKEADEKAERIYEQRQAAQEKAKQMSFDGRDYNTEAHYNTLLHQLDEAKFGMVGKLIQLTPRNEEERDIVLGEISRRINRMDNSDGSGYAFPSPLNSYSYLQKRKEEVEALHFATVTDLNDGLISLQHGSDLWIAMNEKLMQTTPRNEEQKQIILRGIDDFISYQQKHPDDFGYRRKHPTGQYFLVERKKEVEALKF